MKKILLTVILIFIASCFSTLYSKTFINDTEFNDEDKNFPSHLRNKVVGNSVFETKSKVASTKYYEKAIKGIKNDFLSLSRLSLIYSYKGVPEISLYYGSNALSIYNSLPPEKKERIYTINYIELLVGLSVSYSLLMNEPMAYTYLDEAKTKLKSLQNFQQDYKKGEELINYAESFYKKTFYKINTKAKTNTILSPK